MYRCCSRSCLLLLLSLLLPLLLLLPLRLLLLHAHHVSGDWAVSDAYPVTFTVEGGTGDFDRVIGGTVTFKADKSAKYTLYYA